MGWFGHHIVAVVAYNAEYVSSKPTHPVPALPERSGS